MTTSIVNGNDCHDLVMSTTIFEEKKQRLSAYLHTHPASNIRLQKPTSNLFRERKSTDGTRLNVKHFNNVLGVYPESGYVEVEGMTPYANLVDACLAHGVMPTVVPQLKSITIGGAVTGCGIEASSFKYGLVHETVQEMEILLPDGNTVICTADNEYRDLFYGFPNSYGTLGYVLRLKVMVVPVKPYVRLRHLRYDNPKSFFTDLATWCGQPINFIDGVVFSPEEMYLTIGEFVDQSTYTSDYTYENIYYQSLRRRQEDCLTVADYIWRWDTDWFWCSKNFLVQNPIVRMMAGKTRLNSVTYTKIMRWNSKWRLTHKINKLLGVHAESVIQDVEIPIDQCQDFFKFYFDTIKFGPVWICPTHTYRDDVKYDLYKMDSNKLYVNFGFWDVIKEKQKRPPGYYNKQIEQKVMTLGGMKSLYSDSYFTPDEFWSIYNKDAYHRLKRKYDPKGRLSDLYTKCVQGA
jgi:FAD/FMN-containing dehydrogenase